MENCMRENNSVTKLRTSLLMGTDFVGSEKITGMKFCQELKTLRTSGRKHSIFRKEEKEFFQFLKSGTEKLSITERGSTLEIVYNSFMAA